MKQTRYGRKRNFSVFTAIILGFLIVFSMSLFILLLWAFLSSVKDVSEFRLNKLGLPQGNIWEWAWGNYSYVLSYFKVEVLGKQGMTVNVGVGMQLVNSLIFCIGCAFAGTFVPCVMAYATEKFDFKFGRIIYGIVIVTMVLPIVGAYPSEIQVLKQLGLYDTFVGIIIQKANFLGLYYLVLCANFKLVPKAFTEAADIDGASELSIMFRINFPMIFNTAFTIFLLQFIVYWNDYQTIILYLPSHPTVAYGLFDLSSSVINGLNNVPMRMVGCFLVVIPILIVFIVFRRKIMGNLSMGGIKE